MSSEDSNGFKNVDNLTPFEYALAGVPVPEAQHSPSLMVIEQMRRLAEEVEDAPIAQPRLREFLANGGSIAKRNDRRSLRRRRSPESDLPDGGGFVDITPAELNQPADVEPGESSDGKVAAAAAGAGVAAGFIAGDAFMDGDTNDRDADAVLDDADAVPEDADAVPDDARPVPDGLDLVLASIQAELGHVDPAPDAVPDATEPPESEDGFDPELEKLFGSHDREPAATGAGPLLFGGDDLTQPQDLEGHFADITPPDDEFDDLFEPVPAERSDDDGAILVPAAGGAQMAGILGGLDDLTTGNTESGASQLAAITSNVPLPRRRFGATMWALAGSAAAAVALVVGGLWWTNGLNDRTETETAEAPVIDDNPDESATAAGDGQGSGGQSSDARGSSDSDESSQTTEFGSRDSSAGTSLTTTADGSTTSARRTSTSPRQSTTASAVTRSSTSTTGNDQTSSSDPQTTSTAQPSETTKSPDSTERPTVTVAPGTTRRATTTTAPAAPAFIGDRVTINSSGGRGASGVLVELYNDPSRTGAAGTLIQSSVTSSNGRYGFDVAGGCYVILFYPPDGFEFRNGENRQTACVDPGGSTGQIDAIVHPIARPAGPSGCKVEPPGNEDFRGVEVYENSGNWADSYTFYGDGMGVIVRTRDLGPADDVEGSANREWQSVANGFNHRNVFYVAAERGGVESAPVACSRESGDD